MKEVWKYIEGYDNRYQISNTGKVKSLYAKPRIMKFGSDGSYCYVVLTKSRKCKTIRVHRLVAIYFISNPENKLEVNHIDGDKLNNNSSNLEWATGKENMKHAVKNGLMCSGTRHYAAKLTMDKAREIRLKNRNGYTGAELGREYNVSSRSIYDIVQNISWKEIN